MSKLLRDLFLMSPEGEGGGSQFDDTQNQQKDDTQKDEHSTNQQESQKEKKVVDKTLYDDLAKEHSSLKKRLRALEKERMTEEERLKADADDKDKEIEGLRNEVNRTKAISKLQKSGADNEIIKKLADSLIKGDFDSIVDCITDIIGNVSSGKDKIIETLRLGNTERPGMGDNSQQKDVTVEDFKKMTIDERIKLKINNPDLYEKLSKQK